MLTFPVGHFSNNGGGGGGGNPVFLDDVINSVCFDLDATIAASYDDGVDSQKWFNLIASPADGESQSAYDFYRGNDNSSSTDDPTHNGTVGNDAAYWTLDGGDLFSLVSGANTTLLGDLHKTTGGKDFWIAIAWHQVDNSWPGAVMFTNRGHNGNAQKGIEFSLINNQQKVQLVHRGTSFTSLISDQLSAGEAAGDHITLISHSHSGDESRLWLNSTLKTAAHTFSATTAASALATIGAYSGGASGMSTETRLYSVAIGNEYLSAEGAANIIAHLETRHNRDYTP